MTDISAQSAMIQAAASIAALLPAAPKKTLLGNRQEQLVFSVFDQAAKAAYLRAAQECLNAGYDALGSEAIGQIDLEATHSLISDKSVGLPSLIEMCEPGYTWGGRVVTL